MPPFFIISRTVCGLVAAIEWTPVLDYVELVTATVALIVSLIALYMSSKRAKIFLVLAADTQLEANGYGLSKSGSHLVSVNLSLMAYNIGARSGILTNVTVRPLDKGQAFTKLGLTWSEKKLPVGIEGAGALSMPALLVTRFDIALGAPPEVDGENLANLERKLKGLEDTIHVVLEYEYVTGRAVLPWRNAASKKKSNLHVSIGVGQVRDKVRGQVKQKLRSLK